jgi:cell division protein FtsQ
METRRSNKTKKMNRFLYGFLILVMCIAILILGVFLLFQTREVKIVGLRHVDEDRVREWINGSPLSINSLYIWFRYNERTEDLPRGVANVTVHLTSLWDLEIEITEEEMIGYIYYDNFRVYFDGNGIASLITHEEIEETLEVQGLLVGAQGIQIGEEIPVDRPQGINEVREVLLLVNEMELNPDFLSLEGEDIILHFGEIRANIGNRNFKDRMSQIPPILERLDVYHPGRSGAVRLERFNNSGNLIHFEEDEGEPGGV